MFRRFVFSCAALIAPLVACDKDPGGPPSALPLGRVVVLNGRDPAGVTVVAQDGERGVHLTFDRVQVLAGDAALDYVTRQGQPLPAGGVVVVNENPRTRELVLAPDVFVSGGPALAGTPGPTELSVDELLSALGNKGRTTVLDLSYDPLGYVVDVREKILA